LDKERGESGWEKRWESKQACDLRRRRTDKDYLSIEFLKNKKSRKQ
jgi:hypothetical protein